MNINILVGTWRQLMEQRVQPKIFMIWLNKCNIQNILVKYNLNLWSIGSTYFSFVCSVINRKVSLSILKGNNSEDMIEMSAVPSITCFPNPFICPCSSKLANSESSRSSSLQYMNTYCSCEKSHHFQLVSWISFEKLYLPA